MSSAGTNPNTSGAGYPGYAGVASGNSPFNQITFIVEQMLMMVRTATIVQVKSCTNDGNLAPVGKVTVLPLVKMVNGIFQAQSHGNLVNLPYMRIQGGKSAIIIDPVPGDIGVAIFSDRDISSVVNTQAEAPPGSRRTHDMADGIYLFGILNAQPTQYVQFLYDAHGAPIGIKIVDANNNTVLMNSAGIKLTDVNGNTFFMESGNVNINGLKIDQSGNLTTPGGVQAGTGGADQVTLQTHKHPTAATGAPSSPTPGT